MSFFQNAYDFEVNDGQFINIATGANPTIINNPIGIDPVSAILLQYVATGAMFDSAERCPPGRCHPGTRKKIIEQIVDWVDDPTGAQGIVWLYGPAGSGKSALAQSICEFLAESRPERKGASFFFAYGLTDRGNAIKLLPTISYQLGVHFPSIRSEINKALTQDPTLPTKSMEVQLFSLIVQPVLQCKNPPLHNPVIIIDGLDECADDEEASTQRAIVALIARSIVDYKLPLRFFVASRPEYWIRDSFDVPPLPTITKSLSLRDEFDADEDIRTYLTSEFERIYIEKKRVMGSVTLPWPPTKTVDRLVYEASGQFIYASTVIRFVGKSSRFSNPQEQLCIIISLGPQRAVAFSELDRLYARILSVYPRWETMKRVLGGLLVYDSLTAVKLFLDVGPDELVLVLDGLSSLIDMTKTRSKDDMLHQLANLTSSGSTGQDVVSFCHLSFIEFLKDETRSGPFHIDVDGFRDEITRSLFGIIHRSLDQDYESDRYVNLSIDFATYNWIMYKVAIESLGNSRVDTLQPLIIQMTERLIHLVEFRFGGSMESLVCFAEDMRVLECAIEADLQPFGNSSGWKTEDPQKVDEIRTLLKRFQHAVFLAQKRVMNALTLCRELKVTPVLVYFAELYRGREWISFHTFEDLTDLNNVISTIEQNRHLLHLSYSYPVKKWRVKLVDLEVWLKDGHATRSRIQDSDEWKDQRIFLFHHMLKSTFNGRENWHPTDKNYGCRLILKQFFFDSRSMMDICGRKNRRNPCECLSPLRFIGDLHSKQTVRSESPRKVPGFITSMICWLNRQLTSPQTLELLQDHDEALTQRMIATMKYLFEQYFLQGLTGSYNERLCVKRQETLYDTAHWETLSALPLPQGFHQNATLDVVLVADEEWHPENVNWQTFHDEVFGKMEGSVNSSTPSLIDPSAWHPYLAFRLLNALVKFLYGQAYPLFSVSHFGDDQEKLKFRKSLSYIPKCLSFAEPTSENLEALRLIVYLYPHVVDVDTVTYFLPQGIWPTMAEFLQKYPQSLLSSEELGLFERWLSSPDHLDINKYVANAVANTVSLTEPEPEPEPDLPSGSAETSAVNHPGKRHRAPIQGRKRHSVAPKNPRRKRARKDDESASELRQASCSGKT